MSTPDAPSNPEVRFEQADITRHSLLKFWLRLVVTTAWSSCFLLSPSTSCCVARRPARQPPPPS